jgi:hypothetical protein
VAGEASGEEGSMLGYIFLDVISCGLGGAILLGVILAVPRDQKAIAVSTAPYLVVRLEVTDLEGKPDLQALPNLWVKPPTGPGADLPLEAFDLKTGRSQPGARVFRGPAARELGRTEVFLTGFFRHADGAAQVGQDENAMKVPLYELRLTEPPAGVWEFRARYQNRRDLGDLLGKGMPAIKARLVGYVAGSGRPAESKETRIEFGGLGEPVTLNVTPGKVKHVAAK